MQSTTDTQTTVRQSAIELDDLRLTYGDGTEAVRGITLSVPEGEFFGFLGPNGAGKTTTIKLLATLLRPTDGSLFVDGHDAVSNPRAVRQSIGYMAQETSVDPELTARENLRFACMAYGVPRGQRKPRIESLLELADLADVADKQAKTFSGGMKKRLDVATALVHDPPIVFLDEPTTGLDPTARNRLWDYFRRINDAGTTLFLTTQYLEEADQLCDRIAVIDDGRIVALGSPAELKARVGGDVLDVDLADPTAERVARESGIFGPEDALSTSRAGITVTSGRARRLGTDLLVALRDAGFEVTGFNIRSPTLDDVFIAITGHHVEDAAEGTEPTTDAGSEEVA